MKPITRTIAYAAIIGATYVILTVPGAISQISYGPIQIRPAEALTVLPYSFSQAIPGLYIGCMISNFFSEMGMLDAIAGSALTLIAALLTYWLRRLNKPWLAPIPPIVINAFGVSLLLHIYSGIPYWMTVLSIGISQTIVCYGLGLPLLYALKKRKLPF